MLHKDICLKTSNQKKLDEYKRFGLNIKCVEGCDLAEVDGTIDEVILYKSINAGQLILVEDTVLEINGQEVVDIRWKINELADMDKPKIKFITSLGVLDDGFIYIYRGEVDCKLVDNAKDLVIPDDAFGFDPFLIPVCGDNSSSFYELEKEGCKDLFSPRKLAVSNLLNGLFLAKVSYSQVEPWGGKYQNQWD